MELLIYYSPIGLVISLYVAKLIIYKINHPKKLIIFLDRRFNRHYGLVAVGMAIGKFRVIYSDGNKTVWLPYNEAKTMCALYGGVIQHKLEAEEGG